MIGLADVERDVLIVSCAISAGIHAALTSEHFAEGRGAGLGFLGATVLLAGTRRADAPHGRPSAGARRYRRLLFGLLASYALATTTGLPLLHPDIEPVDGLALATKAIEAVGLLAAMHLLWRGHPAVARLTHYRKED